MVVLEGEDAAERAAVATEMLEAADMAHAEVEVALAMAAVVARVDLTF